MGTVLELVPRRRPIEARVRLAPPVPAGCKGPACAAFATCGGKCAASAALDAAFLAAMLKGSAEGSIRDKGIA